MFSESAIAVMKSLVKVVNGGLVDLINRVLRYSMNYRSLGEMRR
jgi:hypothetical protein